MDTNYSRRGFLGVTATTVSTIVANSVLPIVAKSSENLNWPIGCFNRPWSAWSYDDALSGMKSAGFKVIGILGDHTGESFTMPEATRPYLDKLDERIKRADLSVMVAWLRTRHDLPLAEAKTLARTQVDNANRLGVRYLLTTGVDKRESYDHFYQVMADVAAYAAERKIQIVLKPHGGCSLTAQEMLLTLKRVGHSNFRIWYDAGNIIHYSDANSVEDVARVAEYVVGFSAKDCARRGGDVMIQFGEGKVDFRGVFTQLKKANFQGPVLVECCRGRTKMELIDNARQNRRYLEQLFATL